MAKRRPSALTQSTNGSGGGEGKTAKNAAELPLADGNEVRAAVDPRAVYVHVPFCPHKCHYCDFYSVVSDGVRREQFVHRLTTELEAAGGFFRRPAESIFVGGGTPSLLHTKLWEILLAAFRSLLPLADDLEFTVEANPETVDEALIDTLAAGGVNRLSLGVQSFHRPHLATLGRLHEPAGVARSVELARAGGISNISLDLIFAIPGQTPAEWEDDLDAALALEPTHLSCYGLIYEPGTPLTVRREAGLVQSVGEDVEASMYEAAVDRLTEAGFQHYEISNWARSGCQCRHNLIYWTNGQWWPLGPAAAGHVRGHTGGWRWKNVPDLEAYLASGPLPPICDVEHLDADGRVGEALMLGLRMIDGIELTRLEALLAEGKRGRQRAEAIETHLAAGLLERRDDHLRLTRRGLLLADTVLSDLI
ncbi:MAG: radical SAM family heme chaperone HemW [Planctomycetota bacterium]|nr:radical SAM family heme chaperone HemW [Planctomycetota bacterium]